MFSIKTKWCVLQIETIKSESLRLDGSPRPCGPATSIKLVWLEQVAQGLLQLSLEHLKGCTVTAFYHPRNKKEMLFLTSDYDSLCHNCAYCLPSYCCAPLERVCLCLLCILSILHRKGFSFSYKSCFIHLDKGTACSYMLVVFPWTPCWRHTSQIPCRLLWRPGSARRWFSLPGMDISVRKYSQIPFNNIFFSIST